MAPAVQNGTIIILNGPSCAGKTTLTGHLQSLLPQPYLDMGLDAFENMQPVRDGRHVPVFYGRAPNVALRGPDLVPVAHMCAAAFAASGAGVLLEHIFFKRRWLKDAVEKFAGLPVLFVGLVCSADEVTRREEERTDRQAGAGQAARQVRLLGPLNAHSPFDLVLDTGVTPVQSCAEIIVQRLQQGPGTAFARLLGTPFLDEADPVIA